MLLLFPSSSASHSVRSCLSLPLVSLRCCHLFVLSFLLNLSTAPVSLLRPVSLPRLSDCWASLVAQVVKNPSVMQETWL